MRLYQAASDCYSALGVDVERALNLMNKVIVSLHCWQTDDVAGFEPGRGLPGGGLAVTGNYPGRARNIHEVRADLGFVLKMLPGRQKISLHAIYGDFEGKPVDRDAISPKQFQSWVEWAKAVKAGLDFNATLFGHRMAESGYTLSSKDALVRSFWIHHVQACRKIADYMGSELREPALHNLWIPDSSKDQPVDRFTHRQILRESLDKIYQDPYRPDHMLDAVESKLFGIGGEAMTVGSHEFYLAYALQRGMMICLDNGHFHPTEQVADKISSLIAFLPGILLHLTRGVRWDSDHVVTFNDEIRDIAQEVIRCRGLGNIHLGLDYFDASINRVGAYISGARAVQKAFLYALLEPHDQLVMYEEEGRLFERLALLEEMKTMPFGAIWDEYCQRADVPVGMDYIGEVQRYEKEELSGRG